MAKILIGLADDAGADAQALGRTLAAFGHDVAYHARAGLTLAEAVAASDAVIIVWSRGGTNGGYLFDLAREAERRGLLIGLRQPGVPDEAIPPEFRAQASPFTADAGVLTRRIAEIGIRRVTDTLRVAAAPYEARRSEPAPPAPAPTPEQAAAATQAADLARKRHEQIVWDQLGTEADREEIKRFLYEFPGGAHAKEAAERLRELEARETAPQRDRRATDLESAQPTLRRSVAGGGEKTFHVGGAPPAETSVVDPLLEGVRAAPKRRRDPVEDAMAAGAGVDPAIGAAVGAASADEARRIEGVGAADDARLSAVSRPSPSGAALEIEAGKLVHKIPNKMWLGEPETVEVRLGREAVEGMAHGLIGRGSLVEENVPIVETMSVSLYARGGGFDIERQSETTQLVRKDAVANTLFGSSEFASWVWRVTPRKTGDHLLCVKVSAGLTDSRGVPTTASLPDREFNVSVAVHAGRAAGRAAWRFGAAALGVLAASLVGAITQDLWWPWLKDWLWP